MINWTEVCKGCGECCGPVPFEDNFLLQNAHKYHEQPVEIEEMLTGLFVPVTETLDCVFLSKITKRCEIYNERPRLCRLQGTIPELPCPKLKLALRAIEGENNYGNKQNPNGVSNQNA